MCSNAYANMITSGLALLLLIEEELRGWCVGFPVMGHLSERSHCTTQCPKLRHCAHVPGSVAGRFNWLGGSHKAFVVERVMLMHVKCTAASISSQQMCDP